MTGREHEQDLTEPVTIGLPHCDPCPPLSEWPDKNLIQGICPRCGKHDSRMGREGSKAARMLRARQLIREATESSSPDREGAE